MRKKPAPKISTASAWPDALHPVIMGQADHRIKASLQLVAGLLQFQADNDAFTRPEEALTDAATRLKSMAHWHVFLAATGKGSRRKVALDSYLNACADHFVDVSTAQSRIVLLVNADPIKVPARIAGMLGQIVNELVILAVRNTPSPNHPGTIQVDCGADADGTIVLQVSDDRKGHMNGHGLRSPETFNMQIVMALVKRLGGSFAAPKPGARVCHRVTIPMPGRAFSARRNRPLLHS